MTLLPLSNVYAAVIDGHMVIHADSNGDMTSFAIVAEFGPDAQGTRTFELHHGTVGRRTLEVFDGGFGRLTRADGVKLSTPIQFFDTATPLEADEADIVEMMRVLSHHLPGAHCHV